MNLYRFIFSDGAMTFATYPWSALRFAAMFARWRGSELLRIVEVRPLQIGFALEADYV